MARHSRQPAWPPTDRSRQSAARYVHGLDQRIAEGGRRRPRTFRLAPGEWRPPTATQPLIAVPAGRRPVVGINNTQVGQDPATLVGSATWASDPTRGTVLGVNGTNAGADTAGPVLDTSGSYTVSAWVNMSDSATYHTVVSQLGPGQSTPAFYLQYSASRSWAFAVNNTSSGGGQTGAWATGTPTLNTWTHLVGEYNAASHTLILFVNGVQAGTATYTTPWNATGPLNIGHAAAGDWFPGKISRVQAWNYALAPTQVTALFQQIS